MAKVASHWKSTEAETLSFVFMPWKECVGRTSCLTCTKIHWYWNSCRFYLNGYFDISKICNAAIRVSHNVTLQHTGNHKIHFEGEILSWVCSNPKQKYQWLQKQLWASPRWGTVMVTSPKQLWKCILWHVFSMAINISCKFLQDFAQVRISFNILRNQNELCCTNMREFLYFKHIQT